MDHLWFTCASSMVHLCFTCGSPVLQLWFTCGSHVVHLWFTCGSPVNHRLTRGEPHRRITLRSLQEETNRGFATISFLSNLCTKCVRPVLPQVCPTCAATSVSDPCIRMSLYFAYLFCAFFICFSTTLISYADSRSKQNRVQRGLHLTVEPKR